MAYFALPCLALDAMVMDRLTASPHVVDDAHTWILRAIVLTELAIGTDRRTRYRTYVRQIKRDPIASLFENGS
jgi:hypothetical protein